MASTESIKVPVELESSSAVAATVIARLARAAEPVQTVDIGDKQGVRRQLVVGFNESGEVEILDDIDLEQLRDRPAQKAGSVDADTPGGLIAYAARHLDKDLAAATLWSHLPDGSITVILNDHTEDEAGWRDHRVRCAVARDPDWEAWLRINGEFLGQDAFAEFLDEYGVAFIEPDGARMLEVARTFHVTSGSTFKRAVNDHSGEVQLTYQEDVEAASGATGQATVPREFVLALPIFEGGDLTEVRGQFRYRVRDGRLGLGVKLNRIEEVERHAFGELVDLVNDALGLGPIEAEPPAPRR